MVELKEFNVFDYLTTMEDYKEYIKVLHQEMEKMEYERQPLPEWSTLLAEKDAEISRLTAEVEQLLRESVEDEALIKRLGDQNDALRSEVDRLREMIPSGKSEGE
jgi:chromosome segregation ATPase